MDKIWGMFYWYFFSPLGWLQRSNFCLDAVQMVFFCFQLLFAADLFDSFVGDNVVFRVVFLLNMRVLFGTFSSCFLFPSFSAQNLKEKAVLQLTTSHPYHLRPALTNS